MKVNHKVSCAIAAILSGHTAGAAYAAPEADAAASASSDQIAEITVTAQRRSENMQNVPITIQALTAETLKELNVSTFDDYIRYLPNVSAASNGPGQNEVFMRGLSAGVQSSQGSGSTGLFPNVAIYLDDQSGQLPNRNLDIYAADLERIEILEGPQGTLFGAGAEAGTIRYITNKPKLNVTEGSVEAGYGTTAHGDPNSNVTAVLNLPLLTDKAAVRAVIYDDSRGGYIDNVPSTFTRQPTDIGIHYANYPGGVPPGSPVINNSSVVNKAINPVVYTGMRVEGLYQINDDWNVLLTQMYQNMNSQGVFYQQPKSSDGVPLAPLEVTLFNNAFDKDSFENTAWTVNGKFGDLKAVYTGGYLVRHVNQVGDYTNYARGTYADYYQCYGPGSGGSTNPLKSTCYSPSATWRTVERNEHLQQEFRLSTPDEWRIRGIVGVYYEDNELFDRTAWMYKTIPPCTSNGAPGTAGNTGCLSDVGTFPDTSVENPGVQNDNTSFYQDTRRSTRQTAFFASIDYDLIPKVLTLTAGTRHFDFRNTSDGSVVSSFDCFQAGAPPGGCHNPAVSYNLNAANLRDSESGTKSRGNLTWHVTPDTMVYYTWSQGFRPGGFNQNGGAQHAIGPDGQWQYAVPASYHSDDLTNNEIGWKTEWLNHRLQWNGAVYQENWDNAQISFFDPGLVGNIFYDTNGQNFRVRGIETSVVARVLDGLTLQGAGSWNHSEQTNSPALIDNNPASVNFGKALTETCTAPGACTPITNPFGPIGAPTANSPPIQFSLRARYEWNIESYEAFVQFGASHVGHSFTQAGSNPAIAASGAVSTARLRFEDPAYTTLDASTGVAKDAWSARLYVDNLTNSNASVFTNADQFIVAQTVLRPRVIGGVIGYKF
jgi:outer membrane receptor protein involved in Fe transport